MNKKKKYSTTDGVYVPFYEGTSDDVKPKNQPNGAIFKESDTDKTFVYDSNSKRWVEQPAEGGGIPDAPSDGKTYGRKDGDWEEVTGGGGGTPVPCSYTIKVVEFMDPSTKYDVTNFKSGTGFIGQAVTFNIPAINRALGNSDEHQSGDTWYTVLGLNSNPPVMGKDIVQVILEEDNQAIEFLGTLNGQS